MNKNNNIAKYLELLSRLPLLKKNQFEGLRLVLDPSSIQSYMQEKNEPLGVIYEDNYVIILRDLVENQAQERFGYIRILNKSTIMGHTGVVVLPIVTFTNMDRGILLIRTFRHALREWTFELPRGFGERDLDGPANVRKELLEETGYKANEVKFLGIVQPDTGLLNNPAEVYIAQVDETGKVKSVPERTELIDGVVLCNIQDFESNIIDGKIQDGYTLSAIMLAKAKGYLA